ncbi:hypothetical protein [Effusibacillus dendaii]|uniref:Uncharacterized protein n=1 Tax=Effusibacillus dendaii TaxID=2743772 RepID=A0A7I8DEV9_9BACL|nr:hypothetical protein [Effusibacillus dendaii]BCJ86441.1 hypothetical protein skT53_14260 [Effusibacillus dendaii]
MKPTKIDGNKVQFGDDRKEKEQQRQLKLDAINKKKGKLTIEDLNDKLDVILDILQQRQ